MNFTQRKLPREATPNLRLCPIESVQPYALMLAPVYVYMKLNEKFVSVKAPLDFFTPEELERLRPFENFFMPQFVDSTLMFRQAARTVRGLITWQPQVKNTGEKYPVTPLPPAPFELSDAVLRIIGPLWSMNGNDAGIEPFFVSVFANELCDLLPGDVLRAAREKSVQHYERGIFLSSWAVFMALHLGYVDMGFLNRLRAGVLDEVMRGASAAAAGGAASEIDELVDVANRSLQAEQLKSITPEIFRNLPERSAQKMLGRLKRVKESLASHEAAPTIFGPKGFVDV